MFIRIVDSISRTVLPTLICAMGLLSSGCELPPMSGGQAPPRDPQVVEAERQIQEHLAKISQAQTNAPLTPVGGHATPVSEELPPTIIWSDPSAAAATQRRREAERRAMEAERRRLAEAASADAARREAEEAAKRQARDAALAKQQQPEPEPEVDPETEKQAAAPAEPTASELDRQALLALLAERVQQGQDPAMAKALTMAVLSLADPQRKLDAKSLEGLSPEQRERVEKYHELVVQLGEQLADGKREIDRDGLIDQLDTLFGNPIEIRDFKLCKRVDGFGVYHEIEKGEAGNDTDGEVPYMFYAGKPMRAGLYVELDHFKSVQEDDSYVVRLSQHVQLFTEDGLEVWSEPAQNVVDISRKRRRDFFTTQIIQLPQRVPLGKYLLKIRVTDRTSSTISESSVPLHVVLPRAAAVRQDFNK